MSALYCNSCTPWPRKKDSPKWDVCLGMRKGRTVHMLHRTVPVTDFTLHVRCGWWRVYPYLLYNVTVSMTGRQMQGGIISTVHHIDPCSPHDQHLNYCRAAFSAGPVQGRKAMIVPLRKRHRHLSWSWGVKVLMGGWFYIHWGLPL